MRLQFFAPLLAILLAAGIAKAADPPEVTDFSFDEETQQISFFASSGGAGKNNTFEITSSSAQTTFSGATTGGSTGAAGFGNTWGITPGGANVGQIHTLTISIENENGDDSEAKCLRVVAGSIAGTNVYVEHSVGECVPAASTWGLIIFGIVLLTVGTALTVRRGAYPA